MTFFILFFAFLYLTFLFALCLFSFFFFFLPVFRLFCCVFRIFCALNKKQNKTKKSWQVFLVLLFLIHFLIPHFCADPLVIKRAFFVTSPPRGLLPLDFVEIGFSTPIFFFSVGLQPRCIGSSRRRQNMKVLASINIIYRYIYIDRNYSAIDRENYYDINTNFFGYPRVYSPYDRSAYGLIRMLHSLQACAVGGVTFLLR